MKRRHTNMKRRPPGIFGELELSREMIDALRQAVSARIGMQRDQDDYLQHALDWLTQSDVTVTFKVED